MLGPEKTEKQIRNIILSLVGSGVADDQNLPVTQFIQDSIIKISFSGAKGVSIAKKNKPYNEIYDKLKGCRAYTLKLLDGAIIQMSYTFKGQKIIGHRLAYFPSPYLLGYQNNPKIYSQDLIYADIVAKNIVSFPIRFDFDPKNFIANDHPKTHLTLGQYKNCRIPVSAPLTPICFMRFILQNFYNTAYKNYTEILPSSRDSFKKTIVRSEKKVAFLCVP